MLAKILVALLALGVAGVSSSPLPWKSVVPNAKDRQVSAVSIGKKMVAVGYSKGGILLFKKDGTRVDSLVLPEFGPKRRINDLAWWKSWLLVASEGGLSVWDVQRKQMVVHLSGKKLGFEEQGAYSLGLRGADLWVGGLNQLAQVSLEQKKLQSTWVVPGNSGRSQAILVLGGWVYVGTEGEGVRILDLMRGTWKGFDHFDGLPDGQVTGLELIGNRVLIATTNGLGKIDLVSESAGKVDSTWIITYMTQFNGMLFLNTLDGGIVVDGTTLKAQDQAFKDKLLPNGDVSISDGILVTGGENNGTIWARWPKGYLGASSLDYLPQGFAFRLEGDTLPPDAKVGVRIWFPERPSAVVLLEAIPGTAEQERLVKLPDDAVGRFVVEIATIQGNDLLERRTLQMYRDRSPPTLDLDAIPPFVRETPLIVRGNVLEKTLSTLELVPKGGKIVLDAQGGFEAKVKLEPGMNSFEIVARDQAGNEVRFPMQTVLDNAPPEITWPATKDTVTEPSLHWQMAMKESHFKSITAEPADKVVANASDSLLIVTLHDLQNGRNFINIAVEDEAGNISQNKFEIYMLDERSRIVQSMDDQAKAAAATIVRVDTVYKDAPPCPTPKEAVVQAVSVDKPFIIRYTMKRGETLRLIAEKFYGDREMFMAVAKYNKIFDAEEMCRLPIGKLILVPIWKDIDHGKWNVKQGMESFGKVVVQ